MLKELIDQIIDEFHEPVGSTEPRLICERYRNQFEPGSGYSYSNFVKAAFIEVIDGKPMSRDAHNDVTNKIYGFRFVIGQTVNQTGPALDATNLVEEIFDRIDTATLTVGDRDFKFEVLRYFLVGWYGNIQVYELQFIAS